MFICLANFSLFNWPVIFFCLYEILLGDQLQNKFAGDFKYFLYCWLENALADVYLLEFFWTGNSRRLLSLPERFYTMFIAFHITVGLFIITKENSPLLATLVGIRFQKLRMVCQAWEQGWIVKVYWRCSGEWSFFDSSFSQFRIKFCLTEWCYSIFSFPILCTRGLS